MADHQADKAYLIIYEYEKAALLSIYLLKGHGSWIECASAWYADGRRFDPKVRQNILLLRFGHEKNSTTILSLPLIQEGQLSVTGERMGTKYW